VRVFHVQKVNGIGGSERHLLSLLPGLLEAGLDVRICVLGDPGARDFVSRLDALGVPRSLIAAGADVNPTLVGSLWREMRSYRPDLVHTHLIHADLHGQLAARLARIPGVSSVHGTHDFYGRQPYRSAATVAGRSARMTIAISNHVHRFLERLHITRPGGVRTVHYGIDASQWRSPAPARARARENLGLSQGDVAIGVASRLVPYKGHDLLIRAHAEAAHRAPGLRLLVAGSGPMRGALERQARAQNGDVRFLGFVPDIRSFMGACDVIAFPSQPEFGEGFGLAALEAMAAERAVVASAVCSLPEVLGSDGGMLIDPAAPGELTNALVELAFDPDRREELGARAHVRASSVFSLEAMVERTLSVYGEAMSGTP
jgi:glycosyltransferase involved in cell wall biosynthesis